MGLSRDAFIDALTALGELLPTGKTLSPSAVALAWGMFPITAKELLDAEALLYAMQQLQLDPQPAKELAVPIQLLRYVFPCSAPSYATNGTCTNLGQPILDRGLRDDLSSRMEHPEVFHPLHQQAASKPAAAVIAEHGLAPAIEDHADRLLAAGVDVRLQTKPLLLAAKAAGDLGGGKGLIEAQQGETAALLAAGTLVGYWTLEQLDTPIKTRGLTHWPVNRPWRNLARDWIQSHPKGWAAMQTAAQERLQGSSNVVGSGSSAKQAEDAFSGLAEASESSMGSLLGW